MSYLILMEALPQCTSIWTPSWQTRRLSSYEFYPSCRTARTVEKLSTNRSLCGFLFLFAEPSEFQNDRKLWDIDSETTRWIRSKSLWSNTSGMPFSWHQIGQRQKSEVPLRHPDWDHSFTAGAQVPSFQLPHLPAWQPRGTDIWRWSALGDQMVSVAQDGSKMGRSRVPWLVPAAGGQFGVPTLNDTRMGGMV